MSAPKVSPTPPGVNRGGPIALRNPLEWALDVQLEARRGCRYGLVGLRVFHLGRTKTIASTAWDPDSEMVVRLVGDDAHDAPIPAGEMILLDPWPTKCCRPSKVLLRKALARKGVIY